MSIFASCLPILYIYALHKNPIYREKLHRSKFHFLRSTHINRRERHFSLRNRDLGREDAVLRGLRRQPVAAGADGGGAQRERDVHVQPERGVPVLPGVEPAPPDPESAAGPQAHVRPPLLPQIPHRQDGPHRCRQKKSWGAAVTRPGLFISQFPH